MLVLGIDDAGRGPLIGPMILAGVLIDKNQEAKLKKYRIRDSKTVPHQERIKLSKLIREKSIAYKVVKVFPEEIDKALNTKLNLNTLEAVKSAEIINSLNNKKKIKVIVDCPSTNARKWREVLLSYVSNASNLEVICEHKADTNHISVGAASILAKVAREEEVEKIKNKYGNIGSGYPSDPDTQEFLKKDGKRLSNSGIFRKSWQTWKILFPAKNQTTLGEF